MCEDVPGLVSCWLAWGEPGTALRCCTICSQQVATPLTLSLSPTIDHRSLIAESSQTSRCTLWYSYLDNHVTLSSWQKVLMWTVFLETRYWNSHIFVKNIFTMIRQNTFLKTTIILLHVGIYLAIQYTCDDTQLATQKRANIWSSASHKNPFSTGKYYICTYILPSLHSLLRISWFSQVSALGNSL